MSSEALAARPTRAAVLWCFSGGKQTVCQSICPSVRSSPLARAGAAEWWQTRSLWPTPREMQHLHASEQQTARRKRVQCGWGKSPRRTDDHIKRASLPIRYTSAAVVPRSPMHRIERERAYILGPRRVRFESTQYRWNEGLPRSPRHSVNVTTLGNL